MRVLLKNDSGLIKETKLGFSWTTLFFGFLPALFRGDLKWAIIMLLVSGVTFGLAWIVFPFIYNKIYVKELLQKGFQPADDASKNLLSARGIILPS